MKIPRDAAVQAVCGAVVGLMIALVLAAIAVPDFSRLPLSWAQVEAFGRVARLSGLVERLARFGAIPLTLSFAVSWVLVARSLNPHLPPFPFRAAPRPGLAWAAVLLSGAGVVSAANAIFSSGRMDALAQEAAPEPLLALGFAVAACAAAWVVISPAGWAGTLKSWRAPWSAADSSWLDTAGLGAAYGALLFAGAQGASKLFDFFFFYNIEVWHPGSQVRFDAVATNVVLLVVLGGASFAAAAGAAAALAAGRLSRRERLRRAAPGLLAAGLTAAAGSAFYADAVLAHDWRAGGLVRAAALPDDAAADSTAVTLGFDANGPKLAVKPWPATARAGLWGASEDVPASEANARALIGFVAARGRSSRYRDAALDAIAPVYAALWEPDEAFSALRGLSSTLELPLVDALIERAWLANAAPLTDDNRARLEALSDPNVFRVRGRYALLTARAWLRFGDSARARSWLATARETGVEEPFSIPAKPPLSAGEVRGRIRIRGGSGRPIKAALFLVPDGEKTAEGPRRGAGDLARLAAAQWVGRDGSFDFRRISEGRYVLSFLAPADVLPADAGVAASRNPGAVVLSPRRPRFDAGAVVLSRGK